LCSAVGQENPVLSGDDVAVGRLAVAVVVLGDVVVDAGKE
jgi:hypothetical protein